MTIDGTIKHDTGISSLLTKALESRGKESRLSMIENFRAV